MARLSKNAPKRPIAKPGGQPAPKQPSWILILLWSVSFFILLRSCSNQPAGPKPTIDQDLANIHADASKLFESKAYSEFNGDLVPAVNEAESNLDSLVKKGKLTKGEADIQRQAFDAKLIEGAVAAADGLIHGAESQVINGVLVARDPQKVSFDKYQKAYQLLDGYRTRFSDSPVWTKPITVGEYGGASRDVAPRALLVEARDKLSELSKRQPVWGVIPGYQLVDALVHLTGAKQAFSYWFAALLLAAVVRGAVWPLSQKQLMWGRQMSKLAPMLREIKDKFKDPAIQQKKTTELYREYGINPFAGCLPIFVQTPLFFAVYECMLHYRFEFQKGTFLWINEAVSRSTHGFTAANLGQKDTALIIFYAVTLLISTLLTPVNDPTQVKQQRTIGVAVALIFPFMMLTGAYPVPAAFVLYWTFTNILATMQSLRAYYLLPAPPLVKVNTGTGGLHPTERKVGWWEKLQQQAQEQLEAKQRSTEEQARRIEQASSNSKPDDQEAPKPSTKPTNGQSKANPKPPSGGKQKPKRRTP